jgi:hypothetical protein
VVIADGVKGIRVNSTSLGYVCPELQHVYMAGQNAVVDGEIIYIYLRE